MNKATAISSQDNMYKLTIDGKTYSLYVSDNSKEYLKRSVPIKRKLNKKPKNTFNTIAKAFVYLLLFVISFNLFNIAHKYATLERGYFALGGEVFILLLPLFAWTIFTFVRESNQTERKEKKQK